MKVASTFAIAACAIILVSMFPVIPAQMANQHEAKGLSARFSAIPPVLNTPVSSNSSGTNAEVEQAYDPASGIIYETWIANFSIGFALSTNKGTTFTGQKIIPGSAVVAYSVYSWDPSISLFQNGTIAIGFMHEFSNGSISPVVDLSFNRGTTFPVSSVVYRTTSSSFSDRDFVAVAPNGTIYVTWNFAPYGSLVQVGKSSGTSDYYTYGDFNGFISYSSNLGGSWSNPEVFSPGYPYGGTVSSPILVSPNGTIMILYEDYNMTSAHKLENGYNYFIESTNGGKSWSNRVLVGYGSGYLPNTDWWIDGCIFLGSNGTIYATYDLSVGSYDYPFLSYSQDGGRTWNTVMVEDNATPYWHLIQGAAGPEGMVYLAWVTNSSSGSGLSPYIRVYSTVAGRFLTPIERISDTYGNATVWGGDTIGVSVLNGQSVGVSWGQATGNSANSEIYFSSASFSVSFYNTTISERGLPSGSMWNFKFANRTYSVEYNQSIHLRLPNGTYQYEATTTNSSFAQASGSFSVVGSAASVTVPFTRNPPPQVGIFSLLFYIGVGIALAVSAVAIVLVLKRTGREP